MKIIYTNIEKLKLSKKRCAHCKKYNQTEKSLKVNISHFCDLDCATSYAFKNKEKGRKIKHAEQKKKLNDNDKRLRAKEAEKAFNAYIRERDKDDPCISCQRQHEGQYHAGHYKSKGAHPELRFEELNCHKQCSACNNYLSGNISNYRPNLINKIGQERVEWLEQEHKAKKYTCDELKKIELKYKGKLKKLKGEL